MVTNKIKSIQVDHSLVGESEINTSKGEFLRAMSNSKYINMMLGYME